MLNLHHILNYKKTNMSKSAILSSSIAKKFWMALTGLFLCLFLIGHLIGNLQLIMYTGAEGKSVFNEYAYFMTHNPAVKILSYLTYFSILFHAIDGFLLAYQNSKARKKKYAYSKPNENSTWASRHMALLGSLILIFIVTHMVNFWAAMHYDETLPLHTVTVEDPNTGEKQKLYLTRTGDYMPVSAFEAGPNGENAQMEIRNKTEFYFSRENLHSGGGYKDLHSLTMAFFGHDKSEIGRPANPYALYATILYVLAMIVLAFHLWQGFASAFQSLGIRIKKYRTLIEGSGKIFAIVVPAAFAIIPIVIYLTK